MSRILIKDLHDHIGKTVTINGWVSVRRDHGKLTFFDIRDRSGIVQTVVTAKDEAHESAETVRPEWVLEIMGTVNARPEKMVNKDQPSGDIEIKIHELKILAEAAELPFDLNADLNLETALDHRPLTMRTERGRDIFTLQAAIVQAYRRALIQRGFMEFQAPALVGGDAEGGAAAFKVAYYNERDAFLATSPQLYKQIMVGVFERSFSVCKVFRGERHATTRHLSEYSSLDFEMGFIKSHKDVMAVLEEIIRETLTTITARHADIFTRFSTTLPLVPNEPFPALKLVEAQEILEKDFGSKALGEPDLDPEHERQICEWVNKEKRSDFVFITHYPVKKRPFYTYEDESDPGYTKSFDLLFRGLEVTTGGQRIHNYDTLISNIEKWGLKPEDFAFYLQAFKYGMPPHGGCATGLERLTARLLDLPNVKEASAFPRDMTRIDTRLTDM